MPVISPQIQNMKDWRTRFINMVADLLPKGNMPNPPLGMQVTEPATWQDFGKSALNMVIPQPEDTLMGLMNPWYHGTSKIDEIQQIGKLLTRAEGAKRNNAAAMGHGVYLTNDIENAKSYVPSNNRGGIFDVATKGNNNFLSIDTRIPEQAKLFEELRSKGLNNPQDVNNYIGNMGYNGIEWITADGSKNLVVFDSNLLNKPKLIMERIPPKQGLASDKDWRKLYE